MIGTGLRAICPAVIVPLRKDLRIKWGSRPGKSAKISQKCGEFETPPIAIRLLGDN
jgi:hypothetical protein